MPYDVISKTSAILRWVFVLGLAPFAAHAAECTSVQFDGAGYTICKVNSADNTLKLFLNDPETGAPLASFDNVDQHLESADQKLRFAMNAGMYHQDRSPVGHYVENSTVNTPLITRDGPGNFGLLPNGVFCIREGRSDVIETLVFEETTPDCKFATQSGPMLVIDGALHPKFLKDSDSLFIRNGVGTSADGAKTWFAISDEPVNFHAFARLFRDHLGVPQALYFDGNISRLYAPEIGRHDGGFPMGPIVGVVAEK
ncbi:phosphodiester glycosidase family protein [Roseovarius rhodophyticola]|uniref:phosphodiester glycosidase family protein n=1 Tax=Roseovarius rhodophyticola TaxID=3080827 RepID=UPI003BAF29DB